MGESAGVLAALCCKTGVTPRVVRELPALFAQLHDRLRARGVPLNWDPVL